MKRRRLINLHYGDMTDSSSLIRIIQELQPDEIYNLAAQSHVKVSFEVPEYTADTDAIGTLRLLEAVRMLGLDKKTRIYQASTSELFGQVQEVPQRETTPFYPRSPYGCAKLYGYWITKNYRESYGMYAVNGILFNHESERRGETFVTRKITLAVARISAGLQSIDIATGRVLVEVDPKYFRPCEVEQLLGDPTKARTKLGWNPRKTSFEQLVHIMVDHDMAMIRKHGSESERMI